MQASENTISFTASPTGEGKWYVTREYHVLNCLVEKITLKQNPEEHLIKSPFGLLNATQQDKQITYNHVMHRYVISLHYYYVPKSMDISDPWASSDPYIRCFLD